MADTSRYLKEQVDLLLKSTGKPGEGRLGGGLKGLKGMGSQLLAFMIASRLMNIPSEIGTRNVRREALRQQAGLVSPENLYYEAALPGAQQEEEMARQALFTQLSGGVIGPSLARGERMIGG